MLSTEQALLKRAQCMNFENKALYLIIVVFQLVAGGLYSSHSWGVDGFYLSELLAMISIVALAYRGMFPFSHRGRIKSAIAWYGSALVSALSVVALANSDRLPIWFPTNHGVWAFLPYAVLGTICLRYDLAMKMETEN
jgi:hypothetical protein